jgi:hypothetical protein
VIPAVSLTWCREGRGNVTDATFPIHLVATFQLEYENSCFSCCALK